jgi:hypothetical protein
MELMPPGECTPQFGNLYTPVGGAPHSLGTSVIYHRLPLASESVTTWREVDWGMGDENMLED